MKYLEIVVDNSRILTKQKRHPISKKKRIKKKWSTRASNFQIYPNPCIPINNGVALVHSNMLNRFKEYASKHNIILSTGNIPIYS